MRTSILAALVFAGGCVTEAPELGSTESHVESANRIALNRIALNRIALNRIALNGLTTLGGADTMLDTAENRDVVGYLVQCALPEGSSITLSDANGTYTFDGAIGLAPGWASGAPSASEKRWVSACLLARTNAYGVSVAISLRGPNAALTVDATEASAYGLREGAFWGDVFGDTLDANACPGPLKLADSQASTLPLRACTVSADGVTTTCGHDYAGACASACGDDSGNYTGCAGVTEVITTYVANE
ncbi:MAG: hypothetical protein AB7T06_42535 [Kofleriaceae bacterium]